MFLRLKALRPAFCAFRKLHLDAARCSEKLNLEHFEPELIRNFCIVAHVDHGKSTLADRLLEVTNTVKTGQQLILDKLEVERERGITVKAQTASMFYEHSDGRVYLLNLVDTPGHVDFSYEVSRSLAACDGALLLVDAKQGIQAQTVANFWLAFERDLSLIPVLNKIDLPDADAPMVRSQLQHVFDFEPDQCLEVSAKCGTNIAAVLPSIVEQLAPPCGSRDKPFRALIFDSWFVSFRGAIAFVVVKDGSVARGDLIASAHSGKEYEVQEVGVMHPEETPVDKLFCGQVGYIIANMKTVREATLGDTLCSAKERDLIQAIPGFSPAKPMVYAGLFPVDPEDYDALKLSLEKLALNDPAVTFEPDSSPAMGYGWRVGFLGLLHMEVFGQRLDQEYDSSVVLTAPSVSYKARIKDDPKIRKKYGGESELTIVDAGKFPSTPRDMEEFLEPMVTATIICPQHYMSTILALCSQRRGVQVEDAFSYLEGDRIILKFTLPLAEIVVDFFDKLKNLTSGFASLDYEPAGYASAQLVKLTVSLNGRVVDEFATLLPKELSKERGRELCERIVQQIPRQQYDVSVKALVGGKTVAQRVIRAYKKDFTQRLKGNFGDPSRLMKKLKHQREGKKDLKNIGDVQIPKEAFINVLKR